MDWKYYRPKFEYEKIFPDFGWPWSGHKFFAYDFVRNIKPEVIVELGTHKGTSFWSFCQAIKDGKIDSDLFAVDTWKGEEHAGFYGEEVFDEVKEIKKKYYKDLRIKLIRKTFDEAVDEFQDKSIDLLHIDGLHTYEAVKHDFENWNLKVKDDGVIIFHDIFVDQNEFGVYKLWEELKKKYKTMEFHHSFGLGILFKNEEKYRELVKDEREMQMRYSFSSEERKNEEIKGSFSAIQRKDQAIQRKDQAIQQKDSEIRQKDDEFQQKKFEIQRKEQELDEIRSSLRWKISNYPYKKYKKNIKPYVPRFVFTILRPFFRFVNSFRNQVAGEKSPGANAVHTKSESKGIMSKYWGLVQLGYREYYYNGWEGLMLSIKRHNKKKRGEVPAFYLKVNDYKNNLVSIGILTKNKLNLIKPCIESILKNSSQKYKIEILIGDTGSTEKGVWKFYREIHRKFKNIKIITFRKYFFSKNYNELFEKHSNGQYLILLNNDTLAKPDWIDNLIDPLADKKIGIVGGKLLYRDETIQHAGVEIHPNGNGTHYYVNSPKDIEEVNYKAIVPSVTFACVAMRHDVYDRFKLSEEFKEEAQDTDFCFRLKRAGFQVLYNPEVEIYHLEGSSRDWTRGELDRLVFNKKWNQEVQRLLAMRSQRIRYNENEYKNSITILRGDGIGDLLMGVSTFKKLREKYPDKKLILGTYKRNVEMMCGFGIFDEFIPIPDGQQYAPLPIPKDSEVYNLINREVKITPIRGEATDDNKKHRNIVFSRILDLDSEYKYVKMPDYKDAREKVLKKLRESGVNSDQKFVVFNLISTNPARSWWEPYYPKLIKAVEKMGFTPLIVGTKDSKYYKSNKAVNLVGKTETIAEFIEAVKLGKYVISTDTSACHITALSGIPFLAIFTGGVKPEARLRYYSKYEVLEPPESLKCYPCWDNGCEDLTIHWKKDPCRLIIKPEEVIEKFKKLVKKYP